MIPFAETERLIIRGIQESDLDKVAYFWFMALWPATDALEQLVAMYDDPRSQRSGPPPVVPKAALIRKMFVEPDTSAAFNLDCIIEAKAPLSADDDDRFVGNVALTLSTGAVKNRDAMFGIVLRTSPACAINVAS
jgi:hypothetical protein